MLTLQIHPQVPVVRSGEKLPLRLDVLSTRDADVVVTLHFPSPDASLTPHSATVKPAAEDGSPLHRGRQTLEATIAAKEGWYTLTARGSDGSSEGSAETLISVTA